MESIISISGLGKTYGSGLQALRGIDLTKLNTVGDLQGGMEEAERYLGFKVVAAEPARGALLGSAPDA